MIPYPCREAIKMSEKRGVGHPLCAVRPRSVLLERRGVDDSAVQRAVAVNQQAVQDMLPCLPACPEVARQVAVGEPHRESRVPGHTIHGRPVQLFRKCLCLGFIECLG